MFKKRLSLKEAIAIAFGIHALVFVFFSIAAVKEFYPESRYLRVSLVSPSAIKYTGRDFPLPIEKAGFQSNAHIPANFFCRVRRASLEISLTHPRGTTGQVNPVRELRSLTTYADGGFKLPSASSDDDHRLDPSLTAGIGRFIPVGLKSGAFSNGVKLPRKGWLRLPGLPESSSGLVLPVDDKDLRKVLHIATPEYQYWMRKIAVEKEIKLKVHLTPDGRVSWIELNTSSGDPALDALIKTAVSRWQFGTSYQND
ncbi:MAG: energy transducer TonB [Candidatus Ratteibacteria bacterium]|nr:energy transducer TonB [Candidatus Ratteibacteria bacterium]